jgi:hypothetical protein
MNTMNMPGFTAELSIYKTNEYFLSSEPLFHHGNSSVQMAQMFTPNPDGPIPPFPDGIPTPDLPIPRPRPHCFRLCTNYQWICTGFPSWPRCFRVCTNYQWICI